MATDCYQSAEAPHSVALASNKYSVKAGSDEVIRIEIDITDKTEFLVLMPPMNSVST